MRISNRYLVLAVCASMSVDMTYAEEPFRDLVVNDVTTGTEIAVKPETITRAQWGAKEPLSNIRMRLHSPQNITIHHSAVQQNRRNNIERKMRNLQIFAQTRERMSTKHVKRAWADVPYHFYIDGSGNIAEGRDIRFAGDTNTNYDPSNHIQIVLEGNFEREMPTPAQITSLRQLVFWLAVKWSIPAERIKSHKDHAPTVCPGKNMIRHIEELRAATDAIMCRTTMPYGSAENNGCP